jgi:LemA protein
MSLLKKAFHRSSGFINFIFMNLPDDMPSSSGNENTPGTWFARNRTLVIGFSVVAVVLVWYIVEHNMLVKADEEIDSKWSQVQNVYQRRADLVPGLVAAVRGSAAHDEAMLRELGELRSQSASSGADASHDPVSLAHYAQAQAKLDTLVGLLLTEASGNAVLQADKNFLVLQSQLEGAENRIAVERRRYIEAVQDYNTRIRRIPTTIAAALGGFKPKANFVMNPGAGDAQRITF